MKKTIFLLFLISSLLLSACGNFSKQEKEELINSTPTDSESSSLIIPYSSYKGLPVELEYDTISRRLSLRMAMKSAMIDDQELEYLKDEVIRIFTLGDKKDPKTGLYFKSYGYPIWGPYATNLLNSEFSNYQCLLFSERVRMVGDTIYLPGLYERPDYYPYLPAIDVGEDNFTRIVNYIEKNGFIVPAQGIPCDYQYTFFDIRGHRHALISIKRDSGFSPAIEGEVRQISVWAYYNGVMNEENFFSYIIRKDRIHSDFSLSEDIVHYQTIKEAYEELLSRVI